MCLIRNLEFITRDLVVVEAPMSTGVAKIVCAFRILSGENEAAVQFRHQKYGGWSLTAYSHHFYRGNTNTNHMEMRRTKEIPKQGNDSHARSQDEVAEITDNFLNGA
uniref:Uncharacterized protein n=1 Tax=Photinus pyralis TaxID=7054 RepID=A0A1Y1M9C9_PHOPY